MASDQLTNFKKPLLLLKLETKNANGQEKKETLLELENKELKSFLKTLKSAQKVGDNASQVFELIFLLLDRSPVTADNTMTGGM